MMDWSTDEAVTLSLIDAIGGISGMLMQRDCTSPKAIQALSWLRKDKCFRHIAASDFNENVRIRCGKYFDLLYLALRKVARDHGYALAFHGSLGRDIDLIAVPWTSAACSQQELADAIQRKGAELTNGRCFIAPHEDDVYHRAGCPGMKPFGQLQWCFHLGGGTYIDLAVVAPNTAAEEDVHRRLIAGEWDKNKVENA